MLQVKDHFREQSGNILMQLINRVVKEGCLTLAHVFLIL